MPSGKLGIADLAAATDTLLYTVPADTLATVNIRYCNRTATNALLRVGITGGGAPADDEYINYDVTCLGNGILEDTGLMMSAGEEVWVHSNIADVTVRVFGVERAV